MATSNGVHLDDVEQRLPDCGIGRFEEAEPRDLFTMRFVVQAILDRGDAANRTFATPRQPQVQIGMRMKRIVAR